eukprot:3590633-Karenia_brevis.AAC.1
MEKEKKELELIEQMKDLKSQHIIKLEQDHSVDVRNMDLALEHLQAQLDSIIAAASPPQPPSHPSSYSPSVH